MVNSAPGSKPKIGFIGLGQMGSRMATRLLEAGYSLTVYNRTREKALPLAQRGASIAATPREAVLGSDVVMFSLADDRAVGQVMHGPEGALGAADKDKIFIDLSTVYPETSRRLSAAAQAKGARMIEAAVSGSTPQVVQGALIVLVGGDESAFQESRPILEVLGRKVFYLGPSGAGSSMKLVVNTLLAVGQMALAEAIVLGLKSGLDKNHLLEVLGEVAVVSPAQKAKLESARREDYPVTFPLRLMCKDLGLILRQAAEVSAPMPATAVTQQMYAAENAKGLEEDSGAIIRWLEEAANVQ
jgi:3-hydroxyisobutyrate dehydrogenase